MPTMGPDLGFRPGRNRPTQCTRIVSEVHPGRTTVSLGPGNVMHDPAELIAAPVGWTPDLLRATNMVGIASPTSRRNVPISMPERDPVKIAYIITRSDLIGGVQVHVRDLATALAARGHEPVVLAGGRRALHRGLARRRRPKPSPSSTWRPPSAPTGIPARWPRSTQRSGDVQPDLVSVHSSKAGVLGRIACPGSWVYRWYSHAHGWNFTPGIRSPQSRGLPLDRAIWRRRSRPASSACRSSIVDWRWPSGWPRRTESSPCTTACLTSNQVCAADPARSPVRLLMIARFEPQKDHPTLFRALAGMPAPGSSISSATARCSPEARAMARDLGLVERVRSGASAWMWPSDWPRRRWRSSSPTGRGFPQHPRGDACRASGGRLCRGWHRRVGARWRNRVRCPVG